MESRYAESLSNLFRVYSCFWPIYFGDSSLDSRHLLPEWRKYTKHCLHEIRVLHYSVFCNSSVRVCARVSQIRSRLRNTKTAMLPYTQYVLVTVTPTRHRYPACLFRDSGEAFSGGQPMLPATGFPSWTAHVPLQSCKQRCA